MSQIPIEQYLTAMKADAIPAAWSGLWFTVKLHLTEPKCGLRHGKPLMCPAGDYTYLYRLTDSTMYTNPPGDLVMEDTEFELKTHIGFILKAYGSVLITGLGLGCVIRGLLQNPRVEHVTCIENSKDVLKLVQPYMPTERLTIIEADALQWTCENTQKFDCAWHDLWTDRDSGEPHLDIWHARLLKNCAKTAKHQGAWALNRKAKKLLINNKFPWMG